MRRIIVATAAAGAILLDGAAGASASTPATATTNTRAASVQSSTSLTSASASALGSGVVPASTSAAQSSGGVRVLADAPAAKEAATHPERRRYRTTRKRSGIGRFFGALAFLFIGLPLLIVLALVVFFMMRRARKQRERVMDGNQSMNNSGMGTQNPNGSWNGSAQGGQGPYPGAQNQPGERGPDSRF